jgi:FlaA1/EpsC-like NDP-sugar epimerase
LKRPDLTKLPGVRIAVLLVLYAFTLALSYWLAYQLRFDFDPAPMFKTQLRVHWWWVVLVKLAILALFGQFSGLLSYFSIPDLRRLSMAVATGSLSIFVFRLWNSHFYPAPRGVILIDFLLSLAGLSMVRLGFRVIRERYLSPMARGSHRMRRVGIIGAGDVGASLAKELFAKRGLGLLPVVFFDDDKNKWRLRVHDVPVVGNPESLLDQRLNLRLDEAIIAMPTAPAKRIGEIVQILQRAHLKFETVPSVDQLATGQVKVSQLRNVEIEDLLGREPVKLQTESIRQILKGRVVMVTGAGGSIGSELCRQISAFNPERLLLVEQSEVQIFQIEQELIERGFGGIVLPLVADVLDSARMHYIFKRYQPGIIFHAAAHKHVPMMESQPSEAIKNNTFATARLAEMAKDHGVDRFVLISTDKAINPTNVMGASKRMAEVFIQALSAANSTPTKFMAVRFGNVLGSSGSVIPIFKKQIAAGGPVKVTHADVTRYFMTIPEAAGLVLQAASQGSGGEIFVLDMGKPVKIVDLAKQLIELSGLRPSEDIEIEFVGLRPGEKLFEELSYLGENITKTDHPKIMRFVSTAQPIDQVRAKFQEVEAELHSAEPDRLKVLVRELVPDYKPYFS